jgi:hypothetical protein
MHVQVSLTMEISASASLTEMEQQIQEAGQQAMREALKQAIRQFEDHHPTCPHCGEKQRRLEGTARRVVATLFGRVAVPRRRFRCQACLRRWCPATSLFARLKGGTISAPLEEAATLTGCSWPYRVASHLLKKLSGAQISAEEMRLLSNRHGKQRAAHQQAQAEQACATPAEETLAEQNGKPPNPLPEVVPAESTEEVLAEQNEKSPLLVGLDGGWVCSREQRGGMEGKVAVVCSQMEDLPLPVFDTTFSWSKRGGPRKPPRQRHRLAKRRYVATFGSSRQLGQQAKAAAQELDAAPARPVVVIADGAEWIKKEQGKHFAQATCILDWAHLWREVSRAIMAAARAKALPQKERDFQLHFHRSCLWLGNVDQALQGLRRLATDLPAEALKPLQKAIRYVENQRQWIGSYEDWSKQGYPVGSGMIERAVAIVINRRMKKRGMRWCRSNATAIVALRVDLLNDDWVTPQRLRAYP